MGTLYYSTPVQIDSSLNVYGSFYCNSFSTGSFSLSGGIYPTVNYTVFGNNAYVTGNYCTAIGCSANAGNGSYTYATAIGASSYAYRQYNVAVGYYARATGQYATAIGSNSTASGNQTTTLGYNAQATNGNSTAIGYNAQTGYSNSTIVGSYAYAYNSGISLVGGSSSASGNDSTLIGFNTYDNGYAYSTILGSYAYSNGSYSVAIGSSASTNAQEAISIGYGSISPIANYVSFDNSDTNRGVTFYDPSKIFFRNEHISNNKTSTSSYTNGKTLQDYLDEKLSYNPTISSSDAGKAIVVNSAGTGYELGNAGGTWGSISGSLANQTDLQTALDAKASTSDVTHLVAKLPDLPSDAPDGVYVLRATKENGTVSYAWGDENLIINTDF